MKYSIYALFAILLFSCDSRSALETLPDDFTGNEVVYSLFSTSEFNISGFVTIKEKQDGSFSTDIQLLNTSGNIFHPVHLHAGSVVDKGQLVSVLNPVLGKEGKSTTHIKSLMINEASPFTYQDFLRFNGSIRIHLDGGPGQDIVLSAANIGTNPNSESSGIAICKDW